MTVVLSVDHVERGEFLQEADAPAFVAAVQEAVVSDFHMIFTIGNDYSLGGDVDFVLYSSLDQVVCQRETRGYIDTIAKNYKAAHYDVINLAMNAEHRVPFGFNSIKGLTHAMTIHEMTEGSSHHLVTKLQNLLDQFKNKYQINANAQDVQQTLHIDLVRYADHKVHKLIDEVQGDPQQPSSDLLKALGKVLSFAGHITRHLHRIESNRPIPSKKEAHSHLLSGSLGATLHSEEMVAELASLLQEDFTYRELLKGFVENPGQHKSDYERYLVYLYDEFTDRVLAFAENLVIQLKKPSF